MILIMGTPKHCGKLLDIGECDTIGIDRGLINDIVGL